MALSKMFGSRFNSVLQMLVMSLCMGCGTATQARAHVHQSSPLPALATLQSALLELGPRMTARLQDRRIMDGLERTASPEQIDPSVYQAVYYVGGSNAIYQVVDDQDLQQISRLKLSNGQYLVSGKRVTCYPEGYEDHAAAYFQHFPFLIRQTIQQHGGLFKALDPEKPYVEIDGRLVTGQNYPSAPLVANAVVNLLQQKSV
jgi:putative intracellular protease/amidase